MRRATVTFSGGLAITEFQSTLSMRRATQHARRVRSFVRISIHALHEESDAYNDAAAYTAKFQSTLSMRRATGWRGVQKTIDGIFQSTLSMRRATVLIKDGSIEAKFQSTLSMRRATRLALYATVILHHFNPRSP